MNKTLRIVFPILTVLLMLFILSNSLQSSDLARQKTGAAAAFLQSLVRAVSFGRLELPSALIAFVPKLGHLAEFALFSLFFSFSIHVFHGTLAPFFQSVLLGGVMLALTDETIQSFVAGRGSRVSDVLIDLCGVLIGYAVAWIILWLFQRKTRR